MKKPKSSDVTVFRELDGTEFKAVLLDDLTAAFRAELSRALDSTNRFFVGNSYPVVQVAGAASYEIKVRLGQKEPVSFPVYVKLDYGTSIDNAPDRIREQHGLDVVQPQKT